MVTPQLRPYQAMIDDKRESVQKLLDEVGIDGRLGGQEGPTLLQAAIINPGQEPLSSTTIMSTVEFLVAEGADVNAPADRNEGRTALQAAAEFGNISVVEYLLNHEANLNAPAAEYKGRTALQAATEKGSYDLISYLLDQGADVNAPAAEHEGRTALQLAAGREDQSIEILQLLLDKGADINAPPAGYGGRTALQVAAGGKSRRIVEYLLDKGADVNAPPAEYEGRTALQAAAEKGRQQIVECLLNNGADIDAPAAQEKGQTAIQAAASQGFAGIVALLASPPPPRSSSLVFYIDINGNTLHRGTRALASGTVYVTELRYALVQTKEVPTAEQAVELDRLGLDALEYVSDNTHLYSHRKVDLARIRELEYVAYADVYPQLFKIQAHLKEAISDGRDAIFRVDVVFHKDVDPKSEHVIKAVADKAHTGPDRLHIGSRKVRLFIRGQFIADVATINEVKSIEEVHRVASRNEIARGVMNADSKVVSSVELEEGGTERVCIADISFDYNHPDLRDHVLVTSSAGQSSDPDGHGTHVAGSLVSIINSRTSPPTKRIILQRLSSPNNDFGYLPDDLSDLFRPPYENDQVRVHTNSWGREFKSYRQMPYDKTAEEIDSFVWKNKDMVILFAAGNNGVYRDSNGIIYPGQIGSEALAKNIITVGSSETQRKNVSDIYGDVFEVPSAPGTSHLPAFPAKPIADERITSDARHVAAFSSRGPTREKRFKPDVVAPGTGIFSARSGQMPYPKGAPPLHQRQNGTSMATPLVAGCAAVLREGLRNRRPSDAAGDWSPSAALIKALIINGAVELTDQYNPGWQGPGPNYSSGFGRVDLRNSIPDDDNGISFTEYTLKMTGDEYTHNREIPGNSALKVTLAWTDYPGSYLVNDLDLLVKSSNGDERHGNMGISRGFDRANNVEQINWPYIPSGKAQIIVRAFRIDRLKSENIEQSFACVWRLTSNSN